jgi:15-cis-phytoene synthase
MQPSSAEQRLQAEADRTHCRAAIKGGSKSFYAASLLLPRRLRDDAYALYAFCRMSDDLVDMDGGGARTIARLRERLARAYSGAPLAAPVDRAFADVVVRHALPRALPEALIDGLEADVNGVVCETLSDVYVYGARVAGSVGAMMAVLMGARSAALLARACDLGVAMQLTNIARDVGEDARNGRLYLPRTWLAAEGVDAAAWPARPVFSPAIGRVVARLLREADGLYAQADAGIAGLPASCRPAIFAARHIYRAIGDDIAARGFDSVSARARVPSARKAVLAARAVGDAVFAAQSPLVMPPLAETAFLVEAVLRTPAPRAPAESVTERVLWVAELFATLDARARDRHDRQMARSTI